MSMDEPFVVPYLKARAEMGKHVHAMRGLYRRLIVGSLDVMRRVDIFAVIEKANVVEGHLPR